MNKPFDIKYVVLSDHPQEGGMEWFGSYDEAAEYVKTTLVAVADAQASDNEGWMPDWIDNVMICAVVGDVVSTPDGLQVQKRV